VAVKGTPHGVEVRGLRVLHSVEDRPLSGLRWVRSLALELLVWEDPYAHWRVLTVYDGPRNPVALRRFTKDRDAERARKRFVEVVEGMSQDTYAAADWQAVLDAV
jgi:hypothetical protein